MYVCVYIYRFMYSRATLARSRPSMSDTSARMSPCIQEGSNQMNDAISACKAARLREFRIKDAELTGYCPKLSG